MKKSLRTAIHHRYNQRKLLVVQAKAARRRVTQARVPTCVQSTLFQVTHKFVTAMKVKFKAHALGNLIFCTKHYCTSFLLKNLLTYIAYN